MRASTPRRALFAAAISLRALPSAAQTPPAPQGVAAPTPVVIAPAPVGEGQSRAVVHYERSRVYYAAGRYRLATAELETAIRLDPAGYNLYFDLGLVYERMARVDRAIDAYRHYAAGTADPIERERAERIVARLQGARVELAVILSQRGRADALFWGVAASSIGVAVLGAVVLFSAVREDDHVVTLRTAGATPMALADALGSANTQHVVADVALLLGVGGAITATLLYFTRDASREPERAGAVLGLAPGSLVVRGRF